MKHSHGRVIDVTTLPDLDRRLAAGARSLAGWRVVGLDLTDRGPALLERSLGGALFLGCDFTDGDDDVVRRAGAIVLPEIPGIPVDTYRTTLYSPGDLYDAPRYHDTLDARTYAWSRRGTSPDDTLAMALHDHHVDAALAAWVTGRDLVGVMGGHALERGSPAYAAAARLGHALGDHLTVATGGGPGAMEAANLGAFLPDGLDDALRRLATVPSFRPDVGAWARVALDVVGATSGGRESLGIPTWHYGHEPPNVFATAIAKFFANAPREALLLEVCTAGHRLPAGRRGHRAGDLPGRLRELLRRPRPPSRRWCCSAGATGPRTLPVWPLLQALAAGRAMEPHVHLVDTVEEAVQVVRDTLSRRGDG